MSDFLVRCWDGYCLVYHRPSGDVHHLTEPYAALLTRLETQAAGDIPLDWLRTSGLVDNAAELTEQELQAAVASATTHFVDAGLLDPERA